MDRVDTRSVLIALPREKGPVRRIRVNAELEPHDQVAYRPPINGTVLLTHCHSGGIIGRTRRWPPSVVGAPIAWDAGGSFGTSCSVHTLPRPHVRVPTSGNGGDVNGATSPSFDDHTPTSPPPRWPPSRVPKQALWHDTNSARPTNPFQFDCRCCSTKPWHRCTSPSCS